MIKGVNSESGSSIRFTIGDGAKEVLRLCADGKIYVQGRLAETDQQLVQEMREFLRETGIAITDDNNEEKDADEGDKADTPQEGTDDENEKSK